jgi:hypothetical protein
MLSKNFRKTDTCGAVTRRNSSANLIMQQAGDGLRYVITKIASEYSFAALGAVLVLIELGGCNHPPQFFFWCVKLFFRFMLCIFWFFRRLCCRWFNLFCFFVFFHIFNPHCYFYFRAYRKTLSNPLLPPMLQRPFRHYIGFGISS